MTPHQLSTIHKLFRSRQNVFTSSLLRQHGYVYKVAFGCSLPDIKEIALMVKEMLADMESPLYGLDITEVAEALWAEDNIRESKMIAPLLYPRGTMTIETAERWVQSIPTPEVADVVCMYAFQYEIGKELISRWKDAEGKMLRYCAKSLEKRLS
ncbi:MAG: DNA alkylation repair protein [Bacteroidales bacterium]|nr:DNA alkylation repair protein [Bacteroidales bacterium]